WPCDDRASTVCLQPGRTGRTDHPGQPPRRDGLGRAAGRRSVVRRGVVPDRGEVGWRSFWPQRGRERGGRRPALVLSPRPYNERAGLALVCPLTSRIKGYPFEVRVGNGGPVAGAILVDHVRSVDWRARQAEPAGRTPPEVLDEVVARLRPLIGV